VYYCAMWHSSASHFF
nr:immunoglobulin light chain junction region [Macaca mulatta]